MAAVDELISREAHSSLLEEPVRQALAEALGCLPEVPTVMVARGLAEVVDRRFGHTFTESFRRRSPYQPGVGDPVPLNSPELRKVTGMRATSPPWRLANRLDETRHVRLAGEWAVQFRVVFDYSISEQLDTLMTPDTAIATCHPNRSIEEMALTHGIDGRTFPILPKDVAGQRQILDHLIGQATAAGASIIVLPELCLTEEIAFELAAWVRRPDGPALLIAGSFHHDDHHAQELDRSRKRNTAVAWLRGHDKPLVHDKHSPGDEPILEGIEPEGWPELRVYVSAEGWHFVIAVCRDLLNPLAVNALVESGANLVLVPAMSETLMAFGGPVAHLVGAGQAFVAVANNPGDWTVDEEYPTTRRPARALFGHPGLGQQTRVVNSPDPGPGIALMRTHSAQIAWVSAEGSPSSSLPSASAHQEGSVPPIWITDVLASAPPVATMEYPSQQITLRHSAVLVLITDGPQGPQILLTQRAQDLSDYPGQIVFPGGVAEPGDGGPVATAVREAKEEVGLDMDTVQVIGCLPPLALPETGFIVHPVLAWTHQATFSGSTNYAEVTARLEVPLSQLGDWRGLTPWKWLDGKGSGEDPWHLGTVTSGLLESLLVSFLRAGLSGERDGNDGLPRAADSPSTVEVS